MKNMMNLYGILGFLFSVVLGYLSLNVTGAIIGMVGSTAILIALRRAKEIVLEK